MTETSKQATDAGGITEEERARWARRLRWEWVEASIWTDPMLIALENGVKGNKWFSLNNIKIPNNFFADNGLANMENIQRQYLAL